MTLRHTYLFSQTEARAWAKRHNEEALFEDVLKSLDQATRKRSEEFHRKKPEEQGQDYPGEHPIQLRPPASPYPNRGFQYVGFGADFALEVCFRSLYQLPEPSRNKIREIMQLSPEAATDRVREIIMSRKAKSSEHP